MTKQEIAQYIIQNNRPIELDKFEWIESTQTIKTNENNVIFNFNIFAGLTIFGGAESTFYIGGKGNLHAKEKSKFILGDECKVFFLQNNCQITAGDNCEFWAGESENDILKTQEANNCSFITGSNCKFITGRGCSFKVKDNCHIMTKENSKILAQKGNKLIRLDVSDSFDIPPRLAIILNEAGIKGYQEDQEIKMLCSKITRQKDGSNLMADEFEWDSKEKILKTNEDYLILNFKDMQYTTFYAKNRCRIDAGVGCRFITGEFCLFDVQQLSSFIVEKGCICFRGDTLEQVSLPAKPLATKLNDKGISGYRYFFDKNTLSFRILQNKATLSFEKFEWDDIKQTLSSNESNLEVNFESIDGITFKMTGNNVTITAGQNCKIEVGKDSTVNAGKKAVIRSLSGCKINAKEGSEVYAGDKCDISALEGSTVSCGNECNVKGVNDSHFTAGSSCEFSAGVSNTFLTESNCKFTTKSNCTFKTAEKCLFFIKDSCSVETGFTCQISSGERCKLKRTDISMSSWVDIPSNSIILTNAKGVLGFKLLG